VRIARTTARGTSYASSFTKPPSPEVLEALDAIADAAAKRLERETPPEPSR
jgi:hypothetical protein